MEYEWRPYVPVAARRLQAKRALERMTKTSGHKAAPVEIEGRRIATSFWGKAWCDNLESYSDFANRLPRGRTYVRNGSVVDLVLTAGKVVARVSGSDLYRVEIEVTPLAAARWKVLCAESAGAIDSVVELLQGRFAKGVMQSLCQPKTGMFPQPSEMRFSCSCPDWAQMCKHVAASLYGVGARLDRSPELFFLLRQVDQKDLIAQAGQALAQPPVPVAAGRVLSADGLEDLFGLDLGEAASSPPTQPALKTPPKKKAMSPKKRIAKKVVVARPTKTLARSRPEARSKITVERMDPAVESGQWTFTPNAKGKFTFSKRG
ncbi:MAG: hypothetical protein ABI672_22030 [Vicinamibacteria bacterium]